MLHVMNNLRNIGTEGIELKCWKQEHSRKMQCALGAYLLCRHEEKPTDLYVLSVKTAHSDSQKH